MSLNETPSVPGEIKVVDPSCFAGWDALTESFPDASVFHGAGWAHVLAETYGHRPLYFCRFEGSNLAAVLPVCELRSVLTGKRGVSLPFADICSPLARHGDVSDLYRAAVELGRERGWRYLECRGDTPGWQAATEAVSFFTHSLDLGGPVDQLFNRMESPVRRAVRKAESTGVRIEFRTDEASVQTYYRMHCRTRQRHGLPPQPIRFFQSIRTQLLEKAHGFVALAFAEETPIAGAVFLHFGRNAIYKFGASLEEYQHLRPNSFLMWRVMEHLSRQGFNQLHFGRTSAFNEGLRRFKLGFGAREAARSYARFDFHKAAFVQAADRSATWANHIFRACPLTVLRLAGRALYPHLS